MRVGPMRVEKEAEHQLWCVSMTIQDQSYFTRWYSSHLYTPREAIEKWMEDTTTLKESRFWINSIPTEQIRAALLFLEAEE